MLADRIADAAESAEDAGQARHCIKKFGGAGGDDRQAGFAGGGAGEIRLGPDEPVANLLVVGERGVGGGDGGAMASSPP